MRRPTSENSLMRVIVGLSGGVDSAVAAWLLKQAGHEVLAVFMKNWEDDDDGEHCSSREDLVDAVSVADHLGIDIDVVNFASEYKERVFSHFLAEHRAGRTPNPDVLCNTEIKFAAFLDYALKLGAERIATGHYAGLRQGRDGSFELVKGADPGKDQSYFLHRLSQEQLARAIFPLAGLHKQQVREIARQIGLPNHAKRDSTGICFIGERPFRAFLERYLPKTPGEMVTPEGRVVGRHQGLAYYTLGQRGGLGLGGDRAGTGEPWYVAGKDLSANRLIVVQGRNHPALRRAQVRLVNTHWIAGVAPTAGRGYTGKTRYRQPDADCAFVAEGETGGRLEFDVPQWAPTPGQYGVLYRGDVCLGGGVIAD
ncbi:MAG: tRNA 2-thiouridine(34) synthase MnmA [Casimicrobiaceae bacterium]|nr:tRNA 2-thiouridine(34) synthase MnmA [Casimicrobiaceae bacterium]MCX8099520.1 tRNA 2-thiouridine(34) synthase MnmA [Casimicrobiaceae bacterium]MDW8312242.1 tRNA 2-thiouridine(34) synthase MnmA [Burkholderiales bacterium]